ncbi:MAG: hypothetical protein KME28_13060 [Pelatocladus maniniholoensis HA4357-MV3]|jgi:DNA-directed RNA polymerase alpha subunit|uniref:RNA polymerase alpha subunit C-terminal domain-containing protein n=1 Tax=Pelatocladus maniniholoensis HA4357-MV3 TaxID=1117104 RepID=A0A9E3LT26_9NOST|nr:hypothetical protein [Pelatocladus maniniholoensis HA4357-MV3]BAZ65568.1 DNA-directed RNA polymerase subunit alpha [Fischerella sp. NIES-4106]
MINKGGRGKKASYSTVVMRVPLPLREKVLQLVQQFYDSLGKDKPVTSIEPIEVNKPVTSIENTSDNKPVTGFESVPIEELGLSVKNYNILKRLQINVIGDLIVYTEKDLLSMKNMGNKSVELLKSALLKQFGLTLKTNT